MMNEEKYWKEVKEIEKNLYYILDKFDTSFPKPLNNKREKAKFFRAYADDKIYNPQFKYERRSYEPEILEELKSIKINTFYDPYGFKRLLKDKVKEQIYAYGCYSNWGSPASTRYSVLFRGLPSKSLLKKAKKFCKEFQRETVKFRVITAKEAATELKKEVKRLTGDKIKVQLVQLPNKVNISPASGLIKINPDERFTTLDIKRLKVHEIGTHYMRYHNGRKFGFEILARGTARYPETEEGLAVFMEDKMGVLSKAQMYIYAGRVIASYYTPKKNFYELFTLLKEYGFKDQDAFALTFRAKRNICDTSQPGGFTKDYVYFKGYHEVAEFEKRNDIRELFAGKIKISDHKLIRRFIEENKNDIVTILDSES